MVNYCGLESVLLLNEWKFDYFKYKDDLICILELVE